MSKPKKRLRPRLSVTIPYDLLNLLDARNNNRSAITELTLARAFDMYDDERRRLKRKFDQEDIAKIVTAARERLASRPDALLGNDFYLAGKIGDEALAQRISDLTHTEQLALFDTIERWWCRNGQTDTEPQHDQFFDYQSGAEPKTKTESK